MHPRSLTAAVAVASISILMLAGCGSSKPTAAVRAGSSSSSAGTAGTTAMTPTSGAATTASSAPTTALATAPTAPTAPATTSPQAATTPTTPQAATTSSASGAGPVTSWDFCAAVEVRLEKLPGVASGRTFFDLIVTNHGGTVCTLPAEPKLVFLAANYKPVLVATNTDPSAPSFKLGPNASAAMSVEYSSASQPPCDAKIAWVQITSPGHDVPFDGRTHCRTDSYSENHWTAGTYAPAQ